MNYTTKLVWRTIAFFLSSFATGMFIGSKDTSLIIAFIIFFTISFVIWILIICDN